MNYFRNALCLLFILSGISFSGEIRGKENLVAGWSDIHYLTGIEEGPIYYARIYASDSMLHIYADFSVQRHIYHYISADNGDSWTYLANEANPEFWINAGPVRAFYDSGKFYTTFEGCYFNHLWWEGFIYFRASTDYGRTWSWSSELREPVHDAAISPNISGNGDTLFVIACQRPGHEEILQLWRSYDAGISWQHITMPFQGGYHTSGLEYDKFSGILHVAFYGYDGDESDIYYARSFDKGETWQDSAYIGFPEDGPCNWPAMESDGMGNIAISWHDYHERPLGPASIYCRISHDAGESWKDAVEVGKSRGFWSDVTIQGKYVGVLWAGIENQIPDLEYRESRDGGLTWENSQIPAYGRFEHGSLVRIGETIHVAVREFYHYNSNIRIDRAAYIRYDPNTVIPVDGGDYNPSRLSLSCYPNPFNEKATIEFAIGDARHVQLAIYDLQGRLVVSLIDDYIPAGVHNILFDATDLASGIYFFRLRAGEDVQTRRMVLLK